MLVQVNQRLAMSAFYLIVGILLGMFAYWLLQDARPFRYHSGYVYGQPAPYYRSWGPPARPAPAYYPYPRTVRRELPRPRPMPCGC